MGDFNKNRLLNAETRNFTKQFLVTLYKAILSFQRLINQLEYTAARPPSQIIFLQIKIAEKSQWKHHLGYKRSLLSISPVKLISLKRLRYVTSLGFQKRTLTVNQRKSIGDRFLQERKEMLILLSQQIVINSTNWLITMLSLNLYQSVNSSNP